MIDAPSLDHLKLEDTRITRRYFAKFARITRHMRDVAATMQAEGALSAQDVAALTGYLVSLTHSFAALAHKYHFAGRLSHAGQLTFDRIESDFPVYAELLEMASDAAQARGNLTTMPSTSALKEQMVRQIVGELTVPTQLQFALSQWLYYEALLTGGLF